MAFMVPEYWYGIMYWCPDTESDYFPADSFTKQDVADECADGNINEVDEARGWWARLSAPGYMDATEWSGPFDTEKEARSHIKDHYEVDPDTGDELPEVDELDEDANIYSVYSFSIRGPNGRFLQKGTPVVIDEYESDPGRGLSYPPFKGRLREDAWVGGWDVVGVEVEQVLKPAQSEKDRMIDFFFGKPGSPKRRGLMGLPSWKGRRR